MVKQVHNVQGSPAGIGTVEDAFMRLFAVTVVLGEFMERGLVERGLTRARAGLIWQLHHDGPVTQRALSRRLRVTPRNVTGLVDALETDGFVTRQPHPTDRRATLVTLTSKGQESAAALARDYVEGAAYLFGDASARDRQGFIATIDAVLARLDQADAADGPPTHGPFPTLRGR